MSYTTKACEVLPPFDGLSLGLVFFLNIRPRGPGGRVDILISDVAAGHTIVVADSSRRGFVERTARQDLIAAIDAKRKKETHYRDRTRGTKLWRHTVQFPNTSDRFLVECATLASRACA